MVNYKIADDALLCSIKATRGCGHVRCFQDPTARAKLTETRAIAY